MKFIFLLLSAVLFLGCNKSASPQEQRAFVENLVGGKEAYQTVATPDHVNAWLLTSFHSTGTYQEKADRSGPVELKPEVAKIFSEILLSFDSYIPPAPNYVRKACKPDFGVRMQFTRGKNIVEFRFCFECDILEVTTNSQWPADFDPSHYALVKAIQSVFQKDKIIKELELRKQ